MDSRGHDVSCDGGNAQDFHDNQSSGHHEDDDRSRPQTGDGASPGKIFVGGLARETTSAQFIKHFEKYGEITDSVIMKDRKTGHPRGFGFITYADPNVVDQVIQETHIINGKQVEIKRTIPKGAIGSRDFKTKKIFVGGIPTTVEEDEFKEFFSMFGEVKEHQIMKDHASNRSRGFGFITFNTEEAVDELLSKGNKIEFAGSKVEIKKAEPKKPNAPPPPSKRYNDSRSGYGGGGGADSGFGDAYGAYGGGGLSAGSYRGAGAYGGRAGAYGGRAGAYGAYGAGDFGAYGGYGGGAMGPYRGDASYGGYSGRYGAAGGLSRGGYDLAGGYGGHGDGFGGYGESAAGGGGYGGSYDSALGGVYGGSSGSSLYGSGRGGYGGTGSGRYHPYAR